MPTPLDSFYRYYDTRRDLIAKITELYFNSVDTFAKERLLQILNRVTLMENIEDIQRDLSNLPEFYQITNYIETMHSDYIDKLSNKKGTGAIDQATKAAYQYGMQHAKREALLQGVELATSKLLYNNEGLLRIQNNTRQYLLKSSNGMGEGIRQKLIKLVGDHILDNIRSGDGAITTANKLSKQLISNFIKVKDKRGREWDPRHYSEMVVRTEIIRSLNLGSEDRMRENDILYVHVPKHDKPCKYCKALQDRVYFIGSNQADNIYNAPHIEVARNAGLHHPNCRHSEAPVTMFKAKSFIQSRVYPVEQSDYNRSSNEQVFMKTIHKLEGDIHSINGE